MSNAMHLPSRYHPPREHKFLADARALVQPGMTILDAGSGRRPLLRRSELPSNCTYVGLDVSKEELLAAPKGAYDDVVVADLTQLNVSLIEKFDLVLSWQVLEHVRYVDQALNAIHAYLRPKGTLFAELSGKYAFYALLNRIIPEDVAKRYLLRLMGRTPSSVFPADYRQCSYRFLRCCLAGWRKAHIISIFEGAGYLRWNRLLQRVYLAYENTAARKEWHALATHFRLHAIK